MNENEKVMMALGNTSTSTEGANDDLKVQLEKSQHTADVWSGRAKKLAEEKAALEEELRKLKSANVVQRATDQLSEEDIGDTPRDFLETSGKLASRMVQDAEARQTEELQKLRAELNAKDESSFNNAIYAANTKFFNDIVPGGDKAAMWEQFKANNRETFLAITASRDVARFNRMVSSFYREIGVPNPSGSQGGSAVPDPASTVGGQTSATIATMGDGQTFTQEQYLAALEKAEDDFRRTNDIKAYRATTEALNAALNEGRVR